MRSLADTCDIDWESSSRSRFAPIKTERTRVELSAKGKEDRLESHPGGLRNEGDNLGNLGPKAVPRAIELRSASAPVDSQGLEARSFSEKYGSDTITSIQLLRTVLV